MLLTFFKSRETKGKMPLSPFDDLTFEFKTSEFETLESMYRIMVTNFVLNVPLKGDVRTFRRKSSLKDHCLESFNYVILDINDIKTKQDQTCILRYFKQYRCILGESRSNNGVDNFNIKGILCIRSLKLNNVKILIDQIKNDLRDYGNVDTSTSNIGSVSAPIGRYNILISCERGDEFEYMYEYEKTPIPLVNYKLDNPRNIQDLCLQVFTSMGFTPVDVTPKGVKFTHETEDYKGGYFWYNDYPFTLYHYSENNINIYNSVSRLPIFKELCRKPIDYSSYLCSDSVDGEVHEINERYIDVDDDIVSTITKFLNSRDSLLRIRSPMGTGKSNVISKVIEEAKEMDMRILICTNRISVANDSLDKYKLKIYNKDKYNSNDSFIVQYDSLHKYDIKKFDVVIFDEFTSLILHARNNINNVLKNLLNFFACFKKNIVIADAFLTGYEYVYMSGKKNIFTINNSYRDNIVIYNYSDFNFFIRSILLHSKCHRITISCTSTKILLALQSLLSSKGLKVYVLTSSTPQVVKDCIYKSFKIDTPKWDVLIYSPTLTVGVSNMCNVDMHFHYDCSSSCDVISSLQMIKRTRKASEIHMYVKNRTQYLKLTYDAVKNDYIQNLNDVNDYNGFFEYNDYAEVRLSNLGQKAIHVDVFRNILEQNHKESLLFLLKYQFTNNPVEITNRFDVNLLLPYINKIKEDNEEFYLNCLSDYIDGNYVYCVDNSKQNVFEALYDIESRVKKDIDIGYRNSILRLTLSDRLFIDKCVKYRVIQDYQNGDIDKSYIQGLISKCLLTNIGDVVFWNMYVNLEFKLKDLYNIKIVNNNQNLKRVLNGCGYVKKYVNGIMMYSVDENVKKFSGFIDV